MNEWDEWKREQEAKLRKTVPQPAPPKPKQAKEPVVTRPITEPEIEKLRRLQKVRLAWWCGDNRFMEQFKNATIETQVTERQAWFIDVLWYKYRRQLGHDGKPPAGYVGRS